MSEPVLLTDIDDRIATLTLNRPDARNALSRELRRMLVKTFDELRQRDDVGVVIVTGAGQAFCAGLDLKEMASLTEERGGLQEVLDASDVADAMQGFDRPIIGAINGFAITGGFEMALACDVLIASTKAQFADTHARVGVLPGWGLSQKLPRLLGIYRAKELSLTGNFLSAEKAEAWGLVNRVVAPEALLPTCRRLARDMLSCDQATLREILRVMDAGFATTLSQGMELEGKTAASHAHHVTGALIAQRRVAVQQRGQGQK
jgi:enoyl-CoA hydratase